MRIIAIEGLDKAGKHTATMILYHFFKAQGLKVMHFSCPRYETPTGKIIRDWLTGDFEACTRTFELLQAADKQHTQDYIQGLEDDGVDVLILDRYLYSQLAYGAYDNDADWLDELARYIRKPDHVIYLDVEPEVSMHRRGKYGDDDRYESDIDRLRATKGKYIEVLERHVDDVGYHIIDANCPALIVKSQVLDVAIHLHDFYYGTQPKIGTETITEEENRMIRSWKSMAVKS